ncbi:MAG TPA: PAS domain S-box protein [Candidatus Latescibacteria bacterium]|nr:PAS domain S-box protein [Candidatus Handelsmanbacteria bacterium]HIL10124.1 PAS domain S-box protein [Candidatus Latescibacterota bacterium]
MMHRLNLNNITFNIWLPYAASILFVTAVMGVYYPSRQEELFRAHQLEALNHLSRTVALGVEISLELENFEGLTRSIEYIANEDKFTFAAVILDNPQHEYEILARYPEGAAVETALQERSDYLIGEQPFSASNFRGKVIVAMDKATSDQTIAELNRPIYYLLIASFFATILLSLVFAQRIARPIMEITSHAQALQRGEYQTEIPLSQGKDEIGVLQNALISLRDDLHQRKMENDHLTANLESMISQRTAELSQTLEDLNRVQGVARLGTFTFLRDLQLLKMSPIAQEITGQDQSQIGYEDFLDLLDRGDKEMLRSCLTQGCPEGRAFKQDVRLWAGDQTTWASIILESFHDDNIVLGIIQDVSERKHAEDALRASETRKAGILESALDCIITIDAAGHIIEWNPASEETFGYTYAEVIGQPLTPFIIPSAMHEDHKKGIAHYLTTGEGPALNNRIELPALRADGSELIVEIAIVPIKTGDSVIFTAYLRDINDRKEAEREIQRLNENLKNRVVEQQQTAEKMRLIAEEAEAANKAKSAFLANTSHEIRTPINAVMGMAQALREEGLDSTVNEQIDTILGASESLLGIINDLLDLSKIESESLSLESAPFDPVEVFNKVQQTLASSVEPKGISFSIFADTNLPRQVKGDALRLRQVLLNLASNAIKFTEIGGVEIRLTSQTDGEDIMLECEVRDTGSGIPADRLDAIFEPFTQVDNTITRTHGGTGLGLSIAKRLVEIMGGTISVESQLGRGSTFRFEIRVSPADLTEADIDEEIAVAPLLRALHILVVEDNKFNRHVCRALLGKKHHIAEAVNGLEALKLLRTRHDFDLILMDVQMPEMDGLSATVEIRRLETQHGWPRIPVIALTANAMDADKQLALDAGMDDFISKPIRRETLLAIIAQNVDKLPNRAQSTT